MLRSGKTEPVAHSVLGKRINQIQINWAGLLVW
uniref:Uncharacterized protein n=1 Tax=Rhizophora mucronata TaxID=61149 RepID=A0A2P2Q8Y1_RHIMU